MRTLFIGIMTGLALLGIAGAQDATSQPPSQATAAARSIRVAPGSVIPVKLTKTIDARKVKQGDQVEAKVTQDLKAQSGDVVVAKDTKFVGHVTEVQASPDQKQSQLGIAFDYATTKAGANAPMPVSIQAIIGPQGVDTTNNGPAPDPAGAPISPPNAPGVAPGMGSQRMGNGPPTAPTLPTGDLPAAAQSASETRQPITTNTRGVVGIPNLTLSTPKDVSQGSVLSSEKGSIKLESGTWMLLRVNP